MNLKKEVIYFKLNEFPIFSETFVVNNLIYAKQNGYRIKIITEKYLGLNNSSQKELLFKYGIEDDVLKNFEFSRNKFIKLFQLLYILSKPRIIKWAYYFYKTKEIDFFNAVSILYKYRKVKKKVMHFHFNRKLNDVVLLTKVGYINPRCIITFHGHGVYNKTFVDFTKNNLWFYNRNVQVVTVNSKFLLNKVELLGINKKKIKLIPPGIDVKLFENKPKSIDNTKEIVLLTVGRLVPVKGHIYSIDAVDKIIKRGYNVTYIIIGSGIEKESLLSKVNTLRLSKHVLFYEAMSQRELIPFFHSSDIFLFPSTQPREGNLIETFGIVSLEAQASGLPVIGFNSGGFPETILEGVTGFAVEDKNVDAMANTIESLIQNPKLYANMSRNAIGHSEKYDLNKMTQKYLDLYETIK